MGRLNMKIMLIHETNEITTNNHTLKLEDPINVPLSEYPYSFDIPFSSHAENSTWSFGRIFLSFIILWPSFSWPKHLLKYIQNGSIWSRLWSCSTNSCNMSHSSLTHVHSNGELKMSSVDLCYNWKLFNFLVTWTNVESTDLVVFPAR